MRVNGSVNNSELVIFEKIKTLKYDSVDKLVIRHHLIFCCFMNASIVPFENRVNIMIVSHRLLGLVQAWISSNSSIIEKKSNLKGIVRKIQSNDRAKFVLAHWRRYGRIENLKSSYNISYFVISQSLIRPSLSVHSFKILF